MMKDVWKEHSVPSDWCDAILVPIPKKGDLGSCDNWRGISLLNFLSFATALHTSSSDGTSANSGIRGICLILSSSSSSICSKS